MKNVLFLLLLLLSFRVSKAGNLYTEITNSYAFPQLSYSYGFSQLVDYEPTYGRYFQVADTFNHCIKFFVFRSTNLNVTATNTELNRRELLDQMYTHGSYGSGNGYFKYPSSIAIYRNNTYGYTYMYVADSGNGLIKLFDIRIFSNYYGYWNMNRTNMNEFYINSWDGGAGTNKIIGMPVLAVDSSNYVYVGENSYRKRVRKFTPNGVVVKYFGTNYQNVGGLVLDSSNNLYVSDYGNIHKFRYDGTVVTNFGTLGNGIDQFNHPMGLSIDLSNYLYVADTWNSRIQKRRASNLSYVTNFGTFGYQRNQFFYPISVLPDDYGRYLYILDQGLKKVKKFKKRN